MGSTRGSGTNSLMAMTVDAAPARACRSASVTGTYWSLATSYPLTSAPRSTTAWSTGQYVCCRIRVPHVAWSSPPIDFNAKPQNRLTNHRGLLGGHRERDFAHGAANRVELLTQIVWEIRRPDGMHFEERTLEPFLNRSVVCFKVVSGQLELLEYPEESVALEIEREPVVRLRHLARPLPVRARESQTPASAMKRRSSALSFCGWKIRSARSASNSFLWSSALPCCRRRKRSTGARSSPPARRDRPRA